MNEDEKFVRKYLDIGVRLVESRKFGTRIMASSNKVLGDSWSAAAEFTRTRLEQIAEVEEEIAVLRQLLPEIGIRAWEHQKNAWSRILARETAALADLKRGLRQ